MRYLLYVVALCCLAVAPMAMLGGCTSTPQQQVSHQDLMANAAVTYIALSDGELLNDDLIAPMGDQEVYKVIHAMEVMAMKLNNWQQPPQTDHAWQQFQRDYVELRRQYLGVYLLVMKYWPLYDDVTRGKLKTVHQQYVVLDATTQGLLNAKNRQDAYRTAKQVGGVMLSILAKG